MRFGIVLIHGYTGSPEDLRPLSFKLSDDYRADSVRTVLFPGHYSGAVPVFDHHMFMGQISLAVKTFQNDNREIVMIGHSTGGILALSFLMEENFSPAMVILASVPKKINAAYPDRWKKHRAGIKEVPFRSIASMISMINSIGSKFSKPFPALIIHGENDELVPSGDALEWEQVFDGYARTVIIPSAGHDIFKGTNWRMAVDIIAQTIKDIAITLNEEEKTLSRLFSVETDVRKFLSHSPASSKHLARCPSGKTLIGEKPLLPPVVNNGPVLANIEITTRCNLQCRYCARSTYSRQAFDMPREMFSALLDMLPHAYQITLVGLGEPLLHSNIIDFVAEASSQGRRVAMVTNAMCLDMSLSKELIRAGLHSIVFSIDGPDQESSSDVRRGSDFNKVIENIKKFTEISEAAGRFIATAVFSAVSKKTVSNLQRLVDVVSVLGVKVLMLTDLNFRQNLKDTLWKNADDNIEATVQKAVAYAFSKELPVLSVHGLEEFDLAGRYKEFLLLPPARLYGRSSKHTWCFSPWQTIPVDVHGNITLCDCQPENAIGNFFTRPFSEIWNGEAMVEYRRRMLSSNPPETCRICPRF